MPPPDETPTPPDAAEVLDAVADRIEEGDGAEAPAPADEEIDGASAWMARLAAAHLTPRGHEALQESRDHLDAAWAAHDPVADAPAPTGRLRQVHQTARDAMEPMSVQQVGYNRELVVAVDRLTRVVEDVATHLEVVDEVDRRAEEGLGRVQAGVATTAVQLDDLAGEVAELAAVVAGLVERVEAVEAATADQRQLLGATRAREDLVLRTVRDAAPAGPSGPAAVLADEADAADAVLLRRLGAAGRPRPEVLVAWARAVAPVVGEAATGAPVLDLDPDRGEWLDVWAELDVVGRGADADPLRAQALVERGHDVVGIDPVAHLAAVADGSVGAVTAAALADVRPLTDLVAVVDQAARVLRPGGALVLAAAHPSTAAGADALWADPRRRPLHPDALVLLALERGFAEAEVVDLPEPGDPDGDPRAYALVARAAGGAAASP